MPTDLWSDFQRDALKQLGIDTLELVERIAPSEAVSTESQSDLKPVSQTAPQHIAQHSASPDVTSAQESTPDTTQTEQPSTPQPSIVEIGQRDAWKTAINHAHGCFVTATASLPNDKRVLIITESPKITTASEQVFADEALAKLTVDMLASINLTDLSFSRWQNVIDYLPYERRDDPEPDTERFHHDFTQKTDNISHILAFGQLTAKLILKTTASIGKVRGQTHTINLSGQDVTVNAFFHPAFLLRAPAHKKTQWQDLKLAYRTIYQR